MCSKYLLSQFFESTTDNDQRKKAKTESEFELDEAMPGYHEFDESDCRTPEDESELDGDLFEIAAIASSSRPPHSTTGAKSSSNFITTTRPRSYSESTRPTQACPICDKKVVMDNADFNAHIDFCLSRGAIMQAQKEASRPASTSASKVDTKPRSFSKRGGHKK